MRHHLPHTIELSQPISTGIVYSTISANVKSCPFLDSIHLYSNIIKAILLQPQVLDKLLILLPPSQETEYC